MRLLFVSQAEGAPRIMGFARELAALGHDVTLIAPGSTSAGLARHLRPPAFLRPGARMETALAALVAKASLQRRPDAAFLHVTAESLKIPAVPAALAAFAIPTVVEMDGNAAASGARGVLRSLAANSRAVIVPHRGEAERVLQELGARTVVAVESGVDLDAVRPGDRDEARRALKLPQEQRMLALVGPLGAEVRLDLLAEAHRKMPGVALLVAGEGPQRGFLDAMALATRPSSPVLYLGGRENADPALVMRAATACVNAADPPGELVGLRYAAAGRRQAAFDDGGRIAALYPGLDALHVARERTPAALRDALDAALDAEGRSGPLPGAAVESVRGQVGWRRAAEELLRAILA